MNPWDCFPAIARGFIRERYRPDSCLISTRVAIGTLAHFGITATPLSVKTACLNAETVRRIDSGEIAPGRRTVVDFDREGAWGVGIGYGNPEPGKWPGHLVAIAGFMLIDLSLDQASRPTKEMPFFPVMLPIVADIYDGFLSGELAAVFNRSDGCRVVYTAFPRDRTYRGCSDWKFKDRSRPIIDLTVAAMRNLIEHPHA